MPWNDNFSARPNFLVVVNKDKDKVCVCGGGGGGGGGHGSILGGQGS